MLQYDKETKNQDGSLAYHSLDIEKNSDRKYLDWKILHFCWSMDFNPKGPPTNVVDTVSVPAVLVHIQVSKRQQFVPV